MGDMGDAFRDLKNHNKALRMKYGIPCPMCVANTKREHPTIMMPGQRCKVDGHRDRRPPLTDEQWADAG